MNILSCGRTRRLEGEALNFISLLHSPAPLPPSRLEATGYDHGRSFVPITVHIVNADSDKALYGPAAAPVLRILFSPLATVCGPSANPIAIPDSDSWPQLLVSMDVSFCRLRGNQHNRGES